MFGVFILGVFVSQTEIPLRIAEFLTGLQVNRYIVLILILLLYVVLGCLMNINAMILLTLPIFWPTIVALNFDPIWFGVVMVIMMEMGQITPPVGILVFVVYGIAKDIPMWTIFKGIAPFVLCQVIAIALLILFPQIALWLPGTMR